MRPRISVNKLSSMLARFALASIPGTIPARTCPVCGWRGCRFTPAGPPNKRRYDACCPKCGCLERHRLAYLVASDAGLDYSVVLHVAPERELSRWLRSRAGSYLSIDLNGGAMAIMDITRLELADASQSLVWASHVLEHVPNDHAAISELHRVLRPGGKAFIQVPIWAAATKEDPGVTTPAERLTRFYQADHLRLYGPDIIDRFKAVGFSAVIRRAQDFGPGPLLSHGLSFASTNEVFIFEKAGDASRPS